MYYCFVRQSENLIYHLIYYYLLYSIKYNVQHSNTLLPHSISPVQYIVIRTNWILVIQNSTWQCWNKDVILFLFWVILLYYCCIHSTTVQVVVVLNKEMKTPNHRRYCCSIVIADSIQIDSILSRKDRVCFVVGIYIYI